MGVFKQLERSSVFPTDYLSKKKWEVEGTKLSDLNIGYRIIRSGPVPYYFDYFDLEYPFSDSASTYNSNSAFISYSVWRQEREQETASFSEFSASYPGCYNSVLSYQGIQQLYYSALKDVEHVYRSGTFATFSNEGISSDFAGTFTGSYDLALQSTLTIPDSRVLGSTAVVYSIPRNLMDDGLAPGTVGQDLTDDWLQYVMWFNPSNPTVHSCTGNEPACGCTDGCDCNCCDYVEYDYFEDLHAEKVWDFEGSLIYEGWDGTWIDCPEKIWIDGKPAPESTGENYPIPYYTNGKVVGDVIYSQGNIIITDDFVAWMQTCFPAGVLSWRSRVPIFARNIVCPIKDFEFNYTFNPSAGSLETGSLGMSGDFTPYISTVGLYNDRYELVAVAKISEPIKKSHNIDTTIKVRIDLT